MAKVKITGHASGNGVITVTAPNTSTDRTITLPDSTGTILDENSSLPAANLTGTVASARITSGSIANDLINSQHYAAASIDNEHIANNAVNTEEIADNAITLAKMASGTDGNIISYDASGNPVAIATGSDGQVLTSTGAGSPPAFETIASGGGKVGQVKSVNFQGAYSAAVAGWTDVNNFTVDITPAATSSKVLVEAMIQLGTNDWAGINIVRTVGGSSTVLNLGNDTVGSKQNSSFGGINVSYIDAQVTQPFPFIFLDSPSTTSQITYKVQVVARYGSTGNTVYINRPHSWNNDSISGRVTASNMVVTEVLA